MKKIAFSVILFFLTVSLNLSAKTVFKSLEEINNFHKLIDFTWKSPTVPRTVVNKMPKEITTVNGLKRIRFFIRVLLPLILMENEKIEKEHDFILSIANKDKWNENDLKILHETAYKYRIIKKDEDISDISKEEKDRIIYFLDYKIRPVPAPIALGQAALESGWGTSRFTFEGNNLFGHVAKNHKNGLKPKNWSGKKRHIKIFQGLQESISAYMLNLNRNRAYRKFRWLRRKYPDNSFKMAEGFGKYAIIKEEYIGRLQLVITKYGLYRLNNSKLEEKNRIKIFSNINKIYVN